MKFIAYNPQTNCLIELKPVKTAGIEGLGEVPPVAEVVATNIRSPEDGALLAASPQLLEVARLAKIAFDWMAEYVNLSTLPPELQPLKLQQMKVDTVLKLSGQ